MHIFMLISFSNFSGKMVNFYNFRILVAQDKIKTWKIGHQKAFSGTEAKNLVKKYVFYRIDKVF